MKQLLILSGKGGTGKTTIASAFIKLSKAKAYADCDVDAPNLHLITKQNSLPKKTDYYGLPKAEIDIELCIECGQCMINLYPRPEMIIIIKSGLAQNLLSKLQGYLMNIF